MKCQERMLRYIEALSIVLFPWLIFLEQNAVTDSTWQIQRNIFNITVDEEESMWEWVERGKK